MKNKIRVFNVLFSIVAGLLIISCASDSQVMRKNITGNAGELVVVISKDAWSGIAGKQIRQAIAAPQLGLPQDEPIFNLIDVPPAAFKSIFKTTRNIIQVRINGNVDMEGVFFKDDIWAYPQATVQINAKNTERFSELLLENKDKIVTYFISAERERLTMNYRKFFERGIYNVLDRDFGVSMYVAPGFEIAEQKENFIWLKYETPDISQGIILYTIPYRSDSTFTVNYLVPVRDSILKRNIPGPTKGSYMTTEKLVEQTFNVFEHNGNYASEMRGLWKLVNDFMGGPYVSLAELDTKNQRVIVAYGYVYAPSKDKRNFLRQVEAMIYSLKMNEQQKNDKINSEVKMSNL